MLRLEELYKCYRALNDLLLAQKLQRSLTRGWALQIDDFKYYNTP